MSNRYPEEPISDQLDTDPESPETETESVEPDPLESIRLERDSFRDQYLRALADFQNFRRRTELERVEFRRYAAEDLVRALLPLLDNFERTIAAAEGGATTESLVGGVQAMDRQLKAALEAKDLSRIPTVGHPFDPDVHEALVTEQDDSVEPGTVLAELEPGYKLGDRVLRAARVKVSSR